MAQPVAPPSLRGGFAVLRIGFSEFVITKFAPE
jgi:hypothetical protein